MKIEISSDLKLPEEPPRLDPQILYQDLASASLEGNTLKQDSTETGEENPTLPKKTHQEVTPPQRHMDNAVPEATHQEQKEHLFIQEPSYHVDWRNKLQGPWKKPLFEDDNRLVDAHLPSENTNEIPKNWTSREGGSPLRLGQAEEMLVDTMLTAHERRQEHMWSEKLSGMFPFFRRDTRRPLQTGIWATDANRREPYWIRDRAAITGERGTNACVPCATAMILRYEHISDHRASIGNIMEGVGYTPAGALLENAAIYLQRQGLTDYTYVQNLYPYKYPLQLEGNNLIQDRGEGQRSLLEMLLYGPFIIDYIFPNQGGRHAFIVDAANQSGELFAVRDPEPTMGATTYTLDEILAGWTGAAITHQAVQARATTLRQMAWSAQFQAFSYI